MAMAHPHYPTLSADGYVARPPRPSPGERSTPSRARSEATSANTYDDLLSQIDNSPDDVAGPRAEQLRNLRAAEGSSRGSEKDVDSYHMRVAKQAKGAVSAFVLDFYRQDMLMLVLKLAWAVLTVMALSLVITIRVAATLWCWAKRVTQWSLFLIALGVNLCQGVRWDPWRRHLEDWFNWFTERVTGYRPRTIEDRTVAPENEPGSPGEPSPRSMPTSEPSAPSSPEMADAPPPGHDATPPPTVEAAEFRRPAVQSAVYRGLYGSDNTGEWSPLPSSWLGLLTNTVGREAATVVISWGLKAGVTAIGHHLLGPGAGTAVMLIANAAV